MNRSALVFTGVLIVGFVGCVAPPLESEETVGEGADAMVLPEEAAAKFDLGYAEIGSLVRADLARVRDDARSEVETRVAPGTREITKMASGGGIVTDARSARAFPVLQEAEPPVEEGVACGMNTCKASEYCCNEDRGLCAPFGAARILKACE
jgi:hypothetical protein